MYAVIIPLVWVGGVQAIAISLGEVVTGAIEILDGAVGTVQGNKVYKLTLTYLSNEDIPTSSL